MIELNNYELMNVCGGIRFFWYVIGAAAILLIGIIDGIRNPQKCNR
ncbi:MAG: hypothetical protein RSF02_00220 [Bacilli bacterium]